MAIMRWARCAVRRERRWLAIIRASPLTAWLDGRPASSFGALMRGMWTVARSDEWTGRAAFRVGMGLRRARVPLAAEAQEVHTVEAQCYGVT